MFKKLAVILPFMFVGVASAAEGSSPGVDLSALTDAIDFGSILVALMACATALVALYAGAVGVRWILRFVRSA